MEHLPSESRFPAAEPLPPTGAANADASQDDGVLAAIPASESAFADSPSDAAPTDVAPLLAVPLYEEPAHIAFWIILAVGAVGYIGLWFGSREMQRIAMAGLQVLPFLGVALLAALGSRFQWARVLTIVYWLLLIGGIGVVAAILTFMARVNPLVLTAPEALRAGNGPAKVFLPGGGWDVLLTLAGVALCVPLGLLGYVPPARRWLVRESPREPDSFVRATALATVIGTALICFIPLIVLGQPPVLLLMTNIKGTQLEAQLAAEVGLRDELYSLMWLVPAAVVAAGYPIRRGLSATLTRVGLVWPSRRQVLFAVVASGVLVVLGGLFDQGVGWLWQVLGWPRTDETAFKDLLKFAINPVGAVVIGVTAGLGEELAVRGVLQPRLGIFLSNLLFTALHAFQYNADALLSVFVFGLILGAIRKYSNTTTSALVHGLYDFTAVLLAYLEVPGF
jgi:uncharacterized protein